jgi:hypothetical protein
MLAEYERQKIRLAAEMQAERDNHKKRMDGLRSEFELADTQCKLLIDGIDESKVLLAEHVIHVSGQYVNAGENRSESRERAIKYLLSGGGALMHEYVGTKDYAHWHGQGSDHSYGMGPKHGTIIFSIGLCRPIRERVSNPALSEEEIDAAVYYLRNLERIQAAQRAAKDSAKAA